MITIPREICIDLPRALTHEWWVTNGLGGYAASTITCTNTRRYHGLLVTALEPPVKRWVMVAKVEEEVEVGGQTFRLGTNEYESRAINPDGYLFLQQARLEKGIPSFDYSAATFSLSKSVWMEYGQHTTYVRYRLGETSLPVTLTLLPFCTYRDFHTETHGNLEWQFHVDPLDGGCRVTAQSGARPYEILLDHGGTFVPLNLWYWRYFHRAEAERGLDPSEDLWLPGLVRARLEPGQEVTLILTAEPEGRVSRDSAAAYSRAIARADQVQQGARDEFESQLFLAADQFIVSRELKGNEPDPVGAVAGVSVPTVIAGYPWFADWGRDTMISLEGLTLTTGRPELARGILEGFARFISEGMLPNRFPDYGEQPEYNTVDATLWYFHAIARYVRASGDTDLLRRLYPKLAGIIQAHLVGTRYNIHVDPRDGLVSAGERGYALTWMDARADDWVVTPRIGKPVEINALWYNALCWMQTWAAQLDKPSIHYAALAKEAGASMCKFWYAEGNYLYDVIDGPDGNDPSLRPNQLIALSLDHTAFSDAQARAVLAAVERDLLTPFGLRTLSPQSPGFVDKYAGNRRARDGAYHQGTVWPWLLGAYVDSKFRLDGASVDWDQFFRRLGDHLCEADLGSISEILEPFEPYRPVGCVAQAWSVAEVLRAYRKVKS